MRSATTPLYSASGSKASQDALSSLLSAVNDHEPWGAFDYARSIADEHQNPAVPLPVGGNLPARAFIGCARLSLSVQAFGSNRPPAQFLPNQQISQCLADRLHLTRLSSLLSSRWIDPNENGLTHAYKLLPSRDKAYV